MTTNRPLSIPVILGTTRKGRMSAHAARFSFPCDAALRRRTRPPAWALFLSPETTSRAVAPPRCCFPCKATVRPRCPLTGAAWTVRSRL